MATNVLAASLDKDLPGAADHPMLSRYKGSVLYMSGSESLGQAQLLFDIKGKPALQSVEGRVSNLFYLAPTGNSSLEIFRNFQRAFAAAGFQTLFACETAHCDQLNVPSVIGKAFRKVNWLAFDMLVMTTFDSSNLPGFHYLSARKLTPAGPVHVHVVLVPERFVKDGAGRVRQFVQIVEPAQIELGKVTVDANGIEESLHRDGKIALYGVQFDTNQAVIRPESADQLREMAQVLKTAPSLKAFIVGHTDNQGEFEANVMLSQKRAQAVVEALTMRYGIAPGRLGARGVANLSPMSSNANDEGRAQNRRVELVLR
jgi:outer membrane protein OmpA-like peptidoglycan-associated protein